MVKKDICIYVYISYKHVCIYIYTYCLNNFVYYIFSTVLVFLFACNHFCAFFKVSHSGKKSVFSLKITNTTVLHLDTSQ